MSSSPSSPPFAESLAHSHVRERAEDWSLVLHSASIPNRVVMFGGTYHVVVEAEHLERAERALEAFAEDLRARAARAPRRAEWGRTFGGYALGFSLLAAHWALGDQEAIVDRGLANSGAILRGEVFRTVTALTLHADYGHALSNAVSAGVFGTLLFRSVGPGLGLALAVGGGALANAANAWLHGPGHFSLGASSSLFAIIGTLCGLQFATRWRHPFVQGTRGAWLPLGASFALLAMLGTGGVRTDILAHFLGLSFGAPLGIATGLLLERPPSGWIQLALAGVTCCGLALAWWAAFWVT